jgi:putative membrane-bound dehydrogenase-like protein
MMGAMLALLLALQLPPEEALRRLRPADDLEVRLFASEPRLLNPACIDVDEKGRIWVAEGVNYRRWAGPRSAEPPWYRKPHRPTGDRIVILEDADGDGRCDRSTVFYEGLDVQAPMGIAVIGNKVWISQVPDLFSIEILPDGTAGRKRIELTGFRGVNGDHCLHSSYLGPDGKLYHCLGDSGGDVVFPDGRRLDVDGKNVVGGVIFRTNPDLTGLEVIAQNHRNPVECATDSFGNTFATDNDHDGRQWVRFHYAMEGGDFGWNGPKGSHWRMEQPGVVPILMRTGAGSPAGLCIYEGSLLPARYRGMAVHADALGVVRGFRMTPDGAAWRVEGAAVDERGRQTVETLSRIRTPQALLSGDDRRFRPSDVAVAPDGSVFVADWHDPVVGGGGMDDPTTGRIYRLIPKGHDGSYRAVAPSTPLERLASPCLAARSRAVLELRAMAREERERLLAPAAASPDRLLRARSLWLLGGRWVREALGFPDPEFRVLAIRALQASGQDLLPLARPLLRDPSPQVRRELLLALRDESGRREELAELASQFDGHDRWYLEAVAIAYRGREQRYLPALLSRFPAGWSLKLSRLLWVLRQPGVEDAALDVCLDERRPLAERLDAVEALGGFDSLEAGRATALIAARPDSPLPLRKAALGAIARQVAVSWKELSDWPPLRAAAESCLEIPELKAEAVGALAAAGTRLLTRWRLSPGRPLPDCKDLSSPLTPDEADAPELRDDWKDALLSVEGQIDIRRLVAAEVGSAVSCVTLLRASEAFDTRLLLGAETAANVWLNGALVWDRHEHRELSPRADAIPLRLQAGVNRLLLRVERRERPWAYFAEIEDPGGRVVEVTPTRGAAAVGAGPRIDPKNPPPLPELLSLRGDVGRGRELYFRSRAECWKCHRVRGQGNDVGPDLSAIGLKLGREGLILSMLRPSDAIQNEFIQWIFRTRSKGIVTGFLVEETPDRILLKDGEGRAVALAPSDVEARKKSELSAMPDTLLAELTKQDLADLVEYLTTLK